VKQDTDYNHDQFFLLWFLHHLKGQNFWNGPFYAGKIFEAIGVDMVPVEWIKELLEEDLIIGDLKQAMLAQLSEKGEDLVLSKPYLFKDIAKEYEWLLDKIHDEKFISQISAFKRGKNPDDIRLETPEPLASKISKGIKKSLKDVVNEKTEKKIKSTEPEVDNSDSNLSGSIKSAYEEIDKKERFKEFLKKIPNLKTKVEEQVIEAFNKPWAQEVAMTEDFFFDKAAEKFKYFKGLELRPPNDKKGNPIIGDPYEYLKGQIDTFYKENNRSGNKYLAFFNSVKNSWEHDIVLIIGQLIAYIDKFAANKNEWNEYEDKRVIANSQVRQRIWFKQLLSYKKELNLVELSPSVRNAVLFLENPSKSSTMFSEEHQKNVFEKLFQVDFDFTLFEVFLEEFFRNFSFKISNSKNKFILYSRILYSEKIRSIWDEDYYDKKNQHEVDVNADDKAENDQVEEKTEPLTLKKATSFWSDSATDIDEFGREGLVSAVVESTNKLFESEGFKDSYTIHLNGEWGSGKSSMLKFFRKELEASDWKIVEYNAWENQAFRDPWWILINAVSKRAGKGDFKGKFNSHRYWKFKLQYRHKFIGLALLATFVVSAVFFFNPPSDDLLTQNIGFYGSIIGLVGTILSVITGLTNNFFYKDVSKEDLKEQFSDHPFKPIRDRFDSIAEDNKLAIFIDDLDRCDVDPTVTLLEGIQNIFKGKRVLYIIAADGEWVSQCFTKKYQNFNSLGGAEGSIGDKFLQKSFQLRVDVPEIDQKALDAFWDRIINDKSKKEEESEESESKFIKPKVESTGIQPSMSQQEVNKKFNEEKKEQIKEFNKDFEEEQEAYLKRFLKEGVSNNPRQMKRFVNQYKVAIYQKIVEKDTDEMSDSEIKNLILQMNYPGLYIQLKKGVLVKEDFRENDSDKQNVTIKSLTTEQQEELRKLLG
jgi:hypothetical protein